MANDDVSIPFLPDADVERLGDYFDVVVVANGSFPFAAAPVKMLNGLRDKLYCCDGAGDSLLSAGYTPVAVLGDGDSISAEVREKMSFRVHIDRDQETNDLTKTMHHCRRLGFRRIGILGATGKREDHTLGNISLLADYMDFVDVVEMWTDYGIFTPVTGRAVFDTFVKQQVSFFCMDDAPLTLEGVQWPVEDRRITRWWQASLNAATGRQVTVCSCGRVIVFRKYR
jgi:thiamine pyrophosphokinase